MERRERLTADERRLLESCYARCECGACKPRHEAIMKALRIIDGLPPMVVDEAQREAWVNGSWDNVEAPHVGDSDTENNLPKDV